MHPSGHIVLVTGAARGIGLALARRFHAAGNQVILVDRDPGALQAAAASLPDAISCVADVALARDRAMLAQRFGDIDVLVNNAGVQCVGEFARMLEADVAAELDVNLVAPVLLTHAMLPQLLQRPSAAVVNVSSVLALMPKQSASVYCATKAALHSFTRSLRWQLEPTSVRVFEVMPHLVDTAMTAGRGRGKITPDDLAGQFWRGFVADRFQIPIGRARMLAWFIALFPALAQRLVRRA